jgi:hypothetical protein
MKHTTSEAKSVKSVRVPPVKDIARLEGKALEPPELTTEEDLRFSADIMPHGDANYKSELDYNGYEDIEDYDNNAYDLNVEKEKQIDPEQELNFDDRRAIPHQDDGEDPVTQQQR